MIRVAPFLLALFLSACLAPSADDSAGAEGVGQPWEGPVRAFGDCEECFEPMLAIQDGAAYAVHSKATSIARINGIEVTYMDVPPPPGHPNPQVTDASIQFDAEGRLWYHNVFTAGEVWPLYSAVQVAMSPDGGNTWPVNHALRWHDQVNDLPTDRNWLAIHGDRVHVFCVCPMGKVPMYWTSTDAGSTFSGPVPLLAAIDMFRLLGAPALLDDGTLSLPYFVAGQAGRHDELESRAGIAAATLRNGQWQRVQIVEPNEAVLCCGILTPTSNGSVLTLAFTDAERRVHLATSGDGVQWRHTETALGPAGMPHPIAADVGDDALVHWYGHASEQWVAYAGRSSGQPFALGVVDRLPSDFAAMAHDGDMVAVAWPGTAGIDIHGCVRSAMPAGWCG